MLAAKFVAASVGCDTVPTEVMGKPSVVIVVVTEGDQLAIRLTPKWRCSGKSRPEGRMTSIHGAPGPVAGIDSRLAGRRRGWSGAEPSQDIGLRQFHLAIGPVHLYGIEEGRPIRADLEAEVVIAQQADQRPSRKPGLESESCVVPGRRLVDGGLDPGSGVVEQQRRGVDRSVYPSFELISA